MNHLRKVNHLLKRGLVTVAPTPASGAEQTSFRFMEQVVVVNLKDLASMVITAGVIGGIWLLKTEVTNDISALNMPFASGRLFFVSLVSP